MARVAWTDEQRRAILAPQDTLLSANAGTGKTTTVVGKVLWLLGLESDLPPPERPCRLDEIAAITFTEKAAHDLKAKLREGIESSARAQDLRWELDRASIGTIHGFCASLLREHALRLGIDPTFNIMEPREARTAEDDIIREVVLERLEAGDEGTAHLFRECGLDGYTFTSGTVDLVRIALRDVRWHRDAYQGWCGEEGLDLTRLRALSPDGLDADDEVVLRHCDTLYRLASSALARWQEHLRAENARDYDALILDARELLCGPFGEAALRSIRRRHRVLIVDEFQDTDAAQRDIAFAIGRGQPRPQLFFVGDPKQSIYRFRGADISVWNAVAEALRDDGAHLSLTRNFRSQPELVDYMNDVGEEAIERTGEALESELPGSRVHYTGLVAGLGSSATAGVELLEAEGRNAEERRTAEGGQVARRIRELVAPGGARIVDPESGEIRGCSYADIAVLYRTRTGIEHYLQPLSRHGIPIFNAARGGLAEQQEILDVVNALRLIDNPADDVAAFAFLRSPFVGLRDEVLARIGLERRGRTFLYQAREVARAEDWWRPSEHADLADVERTALADGLGVLDDCIALAARLPLNELVQELLDRTGYRLHLMLLGESREALGNLQTFVRITEEHRRRSLGTFLDIWKRWDDQDSGIPQAPLYSAADDVVTLTTIHRAKGLEWPIVFFIDTSAKLTSRTWREYWIDRERGPLLGPKKGDTGPRAAALIHRRELEELAEEARLLYVATTRARDRLIIPGAAGRPPCYAQWLEAGRERPVVSDRTSAAPMVPPELSPPVRLEWLDRVAEAPPAELVRPLPPVPFRFLTSATELMMRANEPEQWELRYVHGVEPVWRFTPRSAGAGVPAYVRGTLIHGVLERIQEQRELTELLDEVVGELDAPELEPLLEPGTAYRAALEEELARVVSSEEWRWYTEAEHHRELGFLHLVEARSWRVGAFDLYRMDDEPSSSVGAHIIDFKTHEIGREEALRVARDYAVQVEVYRAAAAVRGSARVMLHFTAPNVVVGDGEVGQAGSA